MCDNIHTYTKCLTYIPLPNILTHMKYLAKTRSVPWDTCITFLVNISKVWQIDRQTLKWSLSLSLLVQETYKQKTTCSHYGIRTGTKQADANTDLSVLLWLILRYFNAHLDDNDHKDTRGIKIPKLLSSENSEAKTKAPA